MKKNNFLLFGGSFVVAILLIAAIYLNALSNRYVQLDDGCVLDKWTRSVYYGEELVYELKRK